MLFSRQTGWAISTERGVVLRGRPDWRSSVWGVKIDLGSEFIWSDKLAFRTR